MPLPYRHFAVRIVPVISRLRRLLCGIIIDIRRGQRVVTVIKVYLRPFVARTAVINVFKHIAPAECEVSDTRYAVGNSYVCQIIAPAEYAFADTCYAVGNSYACKILIIESILIYAVAVSVNACDIQSAGNVKRKENNRDIKKLLGRRIKEIRTRKGMTQEKLAELVGIGERNLSKIECGNNFITAETLSNILSTLDIEASELFSFKHLEDTEELKEELINAIKNESVDVTMLYRFYRSIKK